MEIILIVFILQQSTNSSSKFNRVGYLILVGFCIISYLPWHDVKDLFMNVSEIYKSIKSRKTSSSLPLIKDAVIEF